MHAGELRKNGLKIKLRDQRFKILEMLLERPGEAVTREELPEMLWPADTVVDFDKALNTAAPFIDAQGECFRQNFSAMPG